METKNNNTEKPSNDFYTLLYTLRDIKYEQFLMCSNLNIKNITGYDITVVGDLETVRLFLNDKAISIDIPYYEMKYPEKLEATRFSMFVVLEYTKREAYVENKINIKLFKNKFNDALITLIKHCI